MTTIIDEILERGEIDKRIGLLSLRIISICRDLYSNTYIFTVINKAGVMQKDVRVSRMEIVNTLRPIDMISHKIADSFSPEENLCPPIKRHKAIKSKVRRRIRS